LDHIGVYFRTLFGEELAQSDKWSLHVASVDAIYFCNMLWV